ncbi:sigma-70 family RNA polymerase sigma factor, partial [Candidatus Parcubacteria bacterium]|nr:sigma-70 family RNA polymerase sigma factor [Candidatus Parcubacteria bacterium]
EASLRLHSTESTMIDGLEAKETVEMLNELDEKYREVIVMRYINELSPPEIAQALGISTNAASVKLNYAIKKLRQIIETKKQKFQS